MKKLISIILSIAMLASLTLSIDFGAYAASSGTCGDSLNWTLADNGTLTISGTSRMYDYYDNSLAPWYDQRESVKKVVIDSGIANIGSRAFKDCVNLTDVDWGTIDTIGDHAFSGCTSLKHAFLPGSCTWLWGYAFENCTALQSAYIDYVNSYSATVPEGFFSGCTSLAVLGLGTGISALGTNSVYNCPLTAVISDNTSLDVGNVAKIGWSYRSGDCYKNSGETLRWNFDLEDARLYFTGHGDLDYYAKGSEPWVNFIGGVNFVDFSSTDGATSINTTSFQGRETIERVDFTNIYAIGWGAFAECTNLGSVTFDSCLTAIWNYAFANDTSIVNVYFTQGSNDLHIYPWAFNNCSGTTFWMDLPSNIKYIDDHAFWGTGFNYVKIFSTDCTIGEDAFGNGEGGYARFFGPGATETTTYAWVKNNRENKGYSWWYYCIDDAHSYSMRTFAPTCTEQGYDAYGCFYCDADKEKSNFVDALGHDYRYTGNSNVTLNYTCARCGDTRLKFSAFELAGDFESAISSTAGQTSFLQNNYDGRVDLDVNGVVNAKDFVRLTDILHNPDLTNKETTFNITSSHQHQTIDGFGASAAWWSQDVGNWDNAEDIVKLLYSPTEGIGLNVYRYNLGAGSEDQNDTGMWIPGYVQGVVTGAKTHCFMQSDGTYNWNNDEGAMNCLEIAHRLNPDLRLTLFSNSAPYFMTKNGKTYGSLEAYEENGETKYRATENLDSSQFANFANFVTTCADHFIDEGYNVTSVSPINEPEWEWSGWMNGDGTQSSGQEGCHFDEGTARAFYNDAMIPAIKADSKLNGKVDLEVWESGQMNHGWWFERFLNQCFSTKDYDSVETDWLGREKKVGSGYAGNNANIRSYVDTLSTHSYWAAEDAREATVNWLNGTTNEYINVPNVRCTEYCQMNTDTTTNVLGHIQAEGGNCNGMSIDYGLALADTIYQDMTILNAKEWDWWTGCGRGVYPDSLVYINDSNHDHIETSKRLWCLGNYSKFIKEGAKRIDVETGSAFGAELETDEENIYTWTSGDSMGTDKNNYLECSAYLNPNDEVVIVYVNNSDTFEYTVFNDTTYCDFKTYVTDATRDLELVQTGEIGEAVCIPARSVTTVVLELEDAVETSEEGAYLFTYFTGNSQSEQRIRFAVSQDGYNYTPLNSNNPVITQTKGTLCCRDPYIFKGQDNYYYIVATDMDASTNDWWGNSNTIVYWRSADLVNWSNETIINMSELTGASDIKRFWAPQVLWDENEQKYFVYFALASGSITENLTIMYYCYTDDLLDQSHYSQPQLLYKPAVNAAAIDGDIIYNEAAGKYYLYYKDENNATICYVTSDNLTGPYEDDENPAKVITSPVGLEGCNSFFINGTDTLVMLADAYGDGYFVVTQSTDFENFHGVRKNQYTINNCSPRHGSVIQISDAEYNSLVNNIGF